MDLSEQELQKETMFKDSILSSAKAKSTQIISSAEQWRKEQQAQAKASCETADYDTIAARVTRNFDRELSASMQEARKSLLEHRTTLVSQMFDEVKNKLEAFTNSPDYIQWLQNRLTKYSFEVPEKITILLRPADMQYLPALQQVLPTAVYNADETIQLGGLKISDGHRLFDETLDAGLEAEQQSFYSNSKLAL